MHNIAQYVSYVLIIIWGVSLLILLPRLMLELVGTLVAVIRQKEGIGLVILFLALSVGAISIAIVQAPFILAFLQYEKQKLVKHS